MKQEDREMLLKDLCGRLPYNVKCLYRNVDNEIKIGKLNIIQYDEERIVIDTTSLDHKGSDVVGVFPFLFPLSSMTEEQWMDTPYANLNRNFTFDSFKCGCSTLAFQTYEVDLRYVVDFINWCYKNHFDVNGLIPMGLAIDATNLKIY